MRWQLFALYSLLAVIQGATPTALPQHSHSPSFNAPAQQPTHQPTSNRLTPSTFESTTKQSSSSLSKIRSKVDPVGDSSKTAVQDGDALSEAGEEVESNVEEDSQEEDNSRDESSTLDNHSTIHQKKQGSLRKEGIQQDNVLEGTVQRSYQKQQTSKNQQAIQQQGFRTESILPMAQNNDSEKEADLGDEMDPTTIAIIVALSLLISFPIVKEMRNKATNGKEAAQGEREGLILQTEPGVEQR